MMQTAITQAGPTSFEEFLQWDDGSDRRFEPAMALCPIVKRF